MVGLSDFPYLKTAIECDGAIRLDDGRWSKGFVNDEQLNKCIALGLLVVERRHGMRFAVKPNNSLTVSPDAKREANTSGGTCSEPCDCCGGTGMCQETGGGESPCMNCNGSGRLTYPNAEAQRPAVAGTLTPLVRPSESP